MLVAGLVILFPVVNNRGSMRVCGKFVKFSSSLMRVVWHSDPHTRGLLHSRLIRLLALSHRGHIEERYLPLTTDEPATRGFVIFDVAYVFILQNARAKYFAALVSPSKRICRTSRGPFRWEPSFPSVADIPDNFSATYSLPFMAESKTLIGLFRGIARGQPQSRYTGLLTSVCPIVNTNRPSLAGYRRLFKVWRRLLRRTRI